MIGRMARVVGPFLFAVFFVGLLTVVRFSSIEAQDPVPTPTPTEQRYNPFPTPYPTATVSAEITLRSAPIVTGKGPFDVIADIKNATNLGAFEIQVRFDEDLLEVVSAEPLGFLGSTGRQVTCTSQTAQDGVVALSCYTLGHLPERGPDGDGELAKLVFRPVRGGEARLGIVKTQVAVPEGFANPVMPGGEISVQIEGDFGGGRGGIILWSVLGGVGLTVLAGLVGAAAYRVRRR